MIASPCQAKQGELQWECLLHSCLTHLVARSSSVIIVSSIGSSGGPSSHSGGQSDSGGGPIDDNLGQLDSCEGRFSD
jgi:hypothetical protein